MKNIFLIVMALCFAMLSCSKEQTSKNQLNYKNEDTGIGEDPLEPYDGDCDYITMTPPQPLWNMLDNPTDPIEEKLDRYMYMIAEALSEVSCNQGFSAFMQQNMYQPDPSFPEYLVHIDDLETFANMSTLLDAKFSAQGFDWSIARNDFIWEDHTYEPVVYIENQQFANWELNPYVGIGTDVDVPDSIAT